MESAYRRLVLEILSPHGPHLQDALGPVNARFDLEEVQEHPPSVIEPATGIGCLLQVDLGLRSSLLEVLGGEAVCMGPAGSGLEELWREERG
jgi:hypothetical protein